MKKFALRATLAAALVAPLAAWSQITFVIDLAPPPLPMYAQPEVPGDGYLWTPGYWGWKRAERDYYWVPGTWVRPPNPGALWTPGYWAYERAGYFWHGGYWGRRVGYYGGLNYGYGYGGSGYDGGRWEHGYFRYNTAANNVPAHGAYHVYDAPIVPRSEAAHESFNGGTSSIHGEASEGERREQAAPHGGLTTEQQRHESLALSTSTQRMSVNHGAPPVAATPKSAAFDDRRAERTRGEGPKHEQEGADPKGSQKDSPKGDKPEADSKH